jgi:hypothetical protein
MIVNKLNLYENYRFKIDSGDLIEFASSSVLGWAIRRFTSKDVNHTSTVVKYIIQGDCIPRRYIFEALEYGYVANFLSSRLLKFKGKVYWLPLKKEYDTYRVYIAKIGHRFLGTPYDVGSLIRNIGGAVSSDVKKLFCSEAADEELRESGLLSKDFNGGKRLRPGEFQTTGLFEKRIRIL